MKYNKLSPLSLSNNEVLTYILCWAEIFLITKHIVRWQFGRSMRIVQLINAHNSHKRLRRRKDIVTRGKKLMVLLKFLKYIQIKKTVPYLYPIPYHKILSSGINHYIPIINHFSQSSADQNVECCIIILNCVSELITMAKYTNPLAIEWCAKIVSTENVMTLDKGWSEHILLTRYTVIKSIN